MAGAPDDWPLDQPLIKRPSKAKDDSAESRSTNEQEHARVRQGEPSKQSPAAIIEIARNRARETSEGNRAEHAAEQTAMIARFATRDHGQPACPSRPKR